jgi:hypothetical protein
MQSNDTSKPPFLSNIRALALQLWAINTQESI